MRFKSLALVIALALGVGGAESAIFSQIPKTASDTLVFVPAGYTVLADAKGDLNGDAEEDVAMVLIDRNEKRTARGKELPRLLVILFRLNDEYRLAAVSNTAIMCVNCGGVFGDPFDSIAIADRKLSIEHYGGSSWRWGYSHMFRFQDNDFFLIGRTKVSANANRFCEDLNENAGMDSQVDNFLTGEHARKKISNKRCLLLKDSKARLPVRQLRKLVAFDINNP